MRWEENGRRYLTFKGTTFIQDCYGVNGDAGVNFTCGYNPENIYRKRKATSLINKDGCKQFFLNMMLTV